MSDGAAPLALRLLGVADIQVAGTPLALNDQKARALLCYLAATGRPHTRDHLAALLWSDAPESNARHSLRSSLYHLRQALHARGAEHLLVAEGDLVMLQAGEDACDVTRFRRLLAAGSAPALAEAIALYRGPLLRGLTLADAPLFEEWQRAEEGELRQAYLAALHRLAADAERAEAWDEAISYLQRMVQLDPLAEEVQRRLIGAYLRTDAVGAALRQYRQFETELRQELGLTPAPETRALVQGALRARRTPRPAIRPGARAASAQAALPFIDRGHLLTHLLALSQHPLVGRGVAVLVQGEDGSGKSRLLDELVNQLAPGAAGWLVLRGACSPFDDLLSYGPFLEAFQGASSGDLSDLVSEPASATPDEPGRFFWRVLQALRLLSRDAPVLLAIEDLHWANSATLHLFGLLATRLHSLRVLLVGTVRHAGAIPALRRLTLAASRHGTVHLLSLPPLSLEETMTLLQWAGVGQAPAATLAGWLHERSSGSPFILLEILAQLRAEAILLPVGAGWQLEMGRWLHWRATHTLPETIHDLLAWRLASLSAEARRLLEVLAVADQPLPFDLLREFLDTPPDALLPLLDDLLSRQLVVETSSETFALPHHLLRETVIYRLSPLRRRRIHRRLAEMVEKCPALQQHFPLWQMALHAVLGEDVERARRYGLRVLAELPQSAAGGAAVDFVQHLHDLLAPTASAQEMLQLTAVLGQLHQLLGQLEQAAHWHQQHIEVALQAGDLPAQARGHFEMGELALVTTDYRAAIDAAEAGLQVCAALEAGASAALAARGHRLLGAGLAMEGSDLPAAEGHLQAAAAAHRAAGDIADLCATLFELGNVAAQRGEVARALEFYAEAAHLGASAQVHYFHALAQNNYAYHSLLLGRADDARRALGQGMKLAEQYELLGAFLHLFSTQGELHLYEGEWGAAIEAFQRGLALAEEVGHLERQAGYRAGLALARRGQGDLEGATALLEEALALIRDKGYWHLHTRILLWLAETLLARERLAGAERHLKTALETTRAQGRALLVLQGERAQARLLAARSDWPGANRLFAETLERASHLDLALEAARTRAAWGEALLRSTSPQKGRALLADARQVFAAHGARGELEALGV